MTKARLWVHLAILPAGAVLASYGGLRALLADPFTTCGLLLVALLVTGWGSWWSSAELSRRYRIACCTVSVIVVLLTGRSMAYAMAVSALRADVPLVLREIARHEEDDLPQSFKIPDARYLRKVSVTSGPQDDGIRATFGLLSGTVVAYLSSPRQWNTAAKRKCTSEIQPGWYWHSRCE